MIMHGFSDLKDKTNYGANICVKMLQICAYRS